MPKLPLAIPLGSLRLPLAQGLDQARRLGVQAVEIDARHQLRPADLTPTALRQVRKWLADAGLTVAALSYYTRRGYDTADRLEARIESTKAALRMAYTLGAGVVVNQVGKIDPQIEADSPSLLREVLSELGHYGQRVGARLAAETGAEDGPTLRRLLDALPSGSLAVAFNPGQLVVGGHSPAQALECLGAEVAYVRAADGVRDRARGRGTAVALGLGDVDFPALLGGLEEHGYRGHLAVVAEPGPQALAQLRQGLEYLRAL